jgi:OmpA-OmpF porin, OOP family
MKNFIVAFLIFLIWSFFGLWLFYNVQPLGNSTNDTAVQSDLEGIEDLPMTISDTLEVSNAKLDSLQSKTVRRIDDTSIAEPGGLRAMNESGDIIFLFDDGIGIEKNSAKINIPSTLLDFKYKVNSYLIEHPDQELQIVAYYDASENVSTPNFGESRGTQVMMVLASVGIVKERMVVKPTIKQIEFDSLGGYNNGISFIFNPLNEDRFKTPTFDIPATKTIYPKFVNNDVFVDKVLKDYLVEAQTILNNYPNVTMEIVGHTDNVGNAQDNYVVGLKYARQVRWYFISQGKLDKDRVKATSMGESNAIASNGTERGRLLNRRIEIKYIFNQ